MICQSNGASVILHTGWMAGAVHPVTRMRRLIFLPLRCTMVSEGPDPAPVCRTEGVACRRLGDRFRGA